MKSYFKILIFFLLICLGRETLANSIKVTNFRFAVEPSKVRLVFDVTGAIDYTATAFSDKIVVDIKEAKLDTTLDKIKLSKTPVSSISSKQKGNNLSLILNLKKIVKLKNFFLSKPDRLVLDLYPAEKEKNSASVNIKLPQPKEKKEPNEPRVVLSIEPQEPKEKEGPNVILSVKPQEVSPNSSDTLDNLEQDLINKMYEMNNKENDVNNKDSELREVIVVIDPGHGGRDPGAVGPTGVLEKKVTLAIAKSLRNVINKNKGFHAVLTRDGDYFLPLRKRLGIAHSHKADMFIAIHADAYKNRNAHGASIFALSQRGATSEAARWLAEKENESELGQAILDKNALLRSVLIDLAQTATTSASLEIGGSMLQALSNITSLHSKQVEQAGFVVLKSPDIPSLLVEVGFISHAREELLLCNANYQRELSERLASGVKSYFIRRPPQGTYLAKVKRKDNPRQVATLADSLPSGGF